MWPTWKTFLTMSIFSTFSAICCFNLKKNTDALLQLAVYLWRKHEWGMKRKKRSIWAMHSFWLQSAPCTFGITTCALWGWKNISFEKHCNTTRKTIRSQYSTHACCLQHSHNGILFECCSKLMDLWTVRQIVSLLEKPYSVKKRLGIYIHPSHFPKKNIGKIRGN